MGPIGGVMSKSKVGVEELAKVVAEAPKKRGAFDEVVIPRPTGGPCNATYIVEGEMVLCALELGHEGPHLEEAP